MKNLSKQSGFVTILILLTVIGVAALGLVIWPKVGGLEGIKDKTSSITPTPTPPPNCRYEEVMCIKAPCPPILICDDKKDKIDETASWKVYKNTSIGFELKYPDKWDKVEKPGTNKKNSSQITDATGTEESPTVIYWPGLTLIVFPYDGDFENLVKTAKQIGPFSDERIILKKIKDVSVDGILGALYATADTPKPVQSGYEAYFMNNGEAFLFSSSLDIEQQTLEQILSTFRFD